MNEINDEDRPVKVCCHMAVTLRERCYPRLLLLLHSVATVHVDTALEAEQREVASVAETPGNPLHSQHMYTQTCSTTDRLHFIE